MSTAFLQSFWISFRKAARRNSMAGVYTVSQITGYLKNLFARDYALSNITVTGEVSNCKYHSSGHIYFTLKDEHAAISCVMFAGRREGLSFRLSDGQQLEARGQIAVYEKSGSYQLYVKSASIAGRGLLYERYEALRQELQEMGMFDPAYKKPIPRYAKRIGIVTAPTGAVIQDICNIAGRRNPYTELLLYPAKVQGAGAKESIVRGIRALDRLGLDVMIVGRGGGSIEDLWAFNEECVARAVFDAQTPVISAVGHETDYTITDFVADRRAATPSEAAELATCPYDAFMQELDSLREALFRGVFGKIRENNSRLRAQREKLLLASPQSVLRDQKRRLSERKQRLSALCGQKCAACRERIQTQRDCLSRQTEDTLSERKHRLALLSGQLHGLSPLARLAAGYGYLADQSGRPLRSVRTLARNDCFTAYLSDGKLEASVLRTETYEGNRPYEKENGSEDGGQCRDRSGRENRQEDAAAKAEGNGRAASRD